jgi:hypothetical protein
MKRQAERGLNVGSLAFDRALFPSMANAVPPPAGQASFSWIATPDGGTCAGTVYSDGSRLDGPTDLLARNGWAFVVVGNEGNIIAAAHGVTPPWIDDIPGAEAWAVLQA